MKRLIQVAIALLGCLLLVQAAVLPDKAKPKFPDSSILCNVKIGDQIAKVKKTYGTNYHLFKAEWPGDFSAIIYNDPKAQAQLKVVYGKSVVGITLKVGRIKGNYKAAKSFASLGDYYGLTLGSDLKKFKSVYKQEPTSYRGGKEHMGMVYPSFPDNSWYVVYYYKNKKLVEVTSTLSYG